MIPFYCDPSRVGRFAVSPRALVQGRPATLFKLFVCLTMYQARRDVVIETQQLSLPAPSIRALSSLTTLRRQIACNTCPKLQSADVFDSGCDVTKSAAGVDCSIRPGAACHVKDASRARRRTGDMGKLSTSAWLGLWGIPGLRTVLTEVARRTSCPHERARLLVGRFRQIYRVGRKLATMFVSALATPALAPGLTPWYPAVDGNELVVIDTNVARAVDTLRPQAALKTYDARALWLRDQAARIDLRRFHPNVPRTSPRLVQQALYAFCSRSNRAARGDPCRVASVPCVGCAPALCPFPDSLPTQA